MNFSIILVDIETNTIDDKREKKTIKSKPKIRSTVERVRAKEKETHEHTNHHQKGLQKTSSPKKHTFLYTEPL